MVNRTISTLLIALSLAGCNFPVQPGVVTTKKILENKYSDFTLEIPSQISKTIRRTDKSDAYLTYDNTVTDRRPTDFSIWVFPPESIGVEPCSPSLTGGSEMRPIAIDNGEAEWGKVDVLELMKQEGYNPPYDTDHIKCGGTPSAYAFCSEKDGKTVIICINQMTDNLQLAEDIFKTFRWTK